MVPLTVQFAVAGAGLPVIFGWLVVVDRAGERAGALPDSTAAFGRTVGIAALAGTALAAAAALTPSGSAVQLVLVGLAAVTGLPAYLAFPVWSLLLARSIQSGRTAPRGVIATLVTTPGGGRHR